MGDSPRPAFGSSKLERIKQGVEQSQHEAQSEVRKIRVDGERDGQRLDNYLFNQLKGVPKSMVYRLLRTGQVRINGKRAKPESRLSSGDEVRIPPVRMSDAVESAAPAERQLDWATDAIIHEDARFLVLNKPSGMAAHGGSGVSHGAIELLRAARPDQPMELVHRLDRDTSGVLVIAKKRSALRAVQALIREHQVSKQYLALLVGVLDRDKVKVDAALGKQTVKSGERVVKVDSIEGKESRSTFRVIQRFANATLVEVDIETGRTHQIRVHAQHLGHPVAGDEKYGDKDANRELKKVGVKRLFLHAKSMQFVLPEHGAQAFSAAMPEELKAVLDRLGE